MRSAYLVFGYGVLRVSDRYTFMEWGKIFFLVLGAMLGLQMLVEVQDSFADHLDHGASFLTIMKLYGVMVPSFLPISLPAAILVSILYALGLLHRNNEFLAFRAAGMSVFRVTRSIWMVGLLLSVGLWLLNASLIPWSIERTRGIENDIKWSDEAKTAERSDVGVVYNLSFDNRKDNRMWFMNRFSQYTETGFGVSVS
ncbi:MAG: LptF/LptG family permease, partial [Verrucomicrobiota bacterium]